MPVCLGANDCIRHTTYFSVCPVQMLYIRDGEGPVVYCFLLQPISTEHICLGYVQLIMAKILIEKDAANPIDQKYIHIYSFITYFLSCILMFRLLFFDLMPY